MNTPTHATNAASRRLATPAAAAAGKAKPARRSLSLSEDAAAPAPVKFSPPPEVLEGAQQFYVQNKIANAASARAEKLRTELYKRLKALEGPDGKPVTSFELTFDPGADDPVCIGLRTLMAQQSTPQEVKALLRQTLDKLGDTGPVLLLCEVKKGRGTTVMDVKKLRAHITDDEVFFKLLKVSKGDVETHCGTAMVDLCGESVEGSENVYVTAKK